MIYDKRPIGFICINKLYFGYGSNWNNAVFSFFISSGNHLSYMVYKNLFNNLRDIQEDITELFVMVGGLEEHIYDIHELEIFYGDEHLQTLISHTKEVVEGINFFREKYSFDLYEGEEEQGIFDDEQEEQQS